MRFDRGTLSNPCVRNFAGKQLNIQKQQKDRNSIRAFQSSLILVASVFDGTTVFLISRDVLKPGELRFVLLYVMASISRMMACALIWRSKN